MKIIIDDGVSLFKSFADKLNTSIDENGKIVIPDQFGKGYLQRFKFDPNMRMMIRDYELNEDLLIERASEQNDTEKVIIMFHNLFLSDSENYNPNIKLLQSVQIFSGNIDSQMFFPSKTLLKSIIIGIEVSYLKELLKSDSENHILETITSKHQSFLFEELIPASILKVANEMLSNNLPQNLIHFYYKVKAEELICLLIAELLKRENTSVSAINVKDVQTIYKIRDIILKDLDSPPNLDVLASTANFSKSKLKRLFKQIFGTSIFNYYQSFRMQEAAKLLKENKLSVSEVGFQLGFSNLSHFTRLFEEHIGMKPKRWSMQHN
ncbi:MAG: AraC family transcriptional regulator [Flavobacterium sp.]|nr:MAG: AraC family transcriptional regulator [Flavobacterium sp.]